MNLKTNSTLGKYLTYVEVESIANAAGAIKGVNGLWICHPMTLRRFVDLAIDNQLPGLTDDVIGMEEDL